MPFHVYILQSDSDQSLYIGHTSNFEDRFLRHNQGRSTYTKARRPWRLLYREEVETRASAVRRERELKSFHSRDILLELAKNKR
ncbi:MAG TPA: endonuclease [Nitrospiraceae bacterium]|jgi:putative endonuclease|nr:endonuclease [Nitrospiraceae bacterium]